MGSIQCVTADGYLMIIELSNDFHTACIDMVSPQYELTYVCQDQSYVKMLSHTPSINMVSPQYVLTNAGQDYSSVKKLSHTDCNDIVSAQYESSYA